MKPAKLYIIYTIGQGLCKIFSLHYILGRVGIAYPIYGSFA
jgi:hypothetical protein